MSIPGSSRTGREAVCPRELASRQERHPEEDLFKVVAQYCRVNNEQAANADFRVHSSALGRAGSMPSHLAFEQGLAPYGTGASGLRVAFGSQRGGI
jgi:hypothetical protein